MQTVTVQLFPVRTKADRERAAKIERNFSTKVTGYPIPVYLEDRFGGKHGEVLRVFRDEKGLNARLIVDDDLAWDYATGKAANIQSAIVDDYMCKRTGRRAGETLVSVTFTDSPDSSFHFGERAQAYDIITRSKNGEFFSKLGAALGKDFSKKGR